MGNKICKNTGNLEAEPGRNGIKEKKEMVIRSKAQMMKLQRRQFRRAQILEERKSQYTNDTSPTRS